jgi:tetratricopeptide (TPR) repeat protein
MINLKNNFSAPKNSNYFILPLAFSFFLIFFISNQYSYSQLANDENINPLIEKGNQYFDEQRYEQAIPYYDRVLEIDPNYVEALYNKGAALDSLGKYNEAMQYIDRVLEIDPNYVEALNIKKVLKDLQTN